MAELPDAISFAAARVASRNVDVIKALVEEPRNISRLVEDTGINRSTICHHLSQLEKYGIVGSDYRVITDPSEGAKGRAVREYYLIKEKLAEVQQTLADITDYLRQSMEKVPY